MALISAFHPLPDISRVSAFDPKRTFRETWCKGRPDAKKLNLPWLLANSPITLLP